MRRKPSDTPQTLYRDMLRAAETRVRAGPTEQKRTTKTRRLEETPRTLSEKQALLTGHKPKAVETLLRRQRVGRVATVDTRGRPAVIPFCFVYDGKVFYSPLDEKPKGVAPDKLRRTRNILTQPEVAFVLDHYEEDWDRLWFILVRGPRERLLRSGKEHVRAAGAAAQKIPSVPPDVIGKPARDQDRRPGRSVAGMLRPQPRPPHRHEDTKTTYV